MARVASLRRDCKMDIVMPNGHGSPRRQNAMALRIDEVGLGLSGAAAREMCVATAPLHPGTCLVLVRHTAPNTTLPYGAGGVPGFLNTASMAA
jgi:hypothetical protein